jgi:diguanylate cyclase (GGDEF)-like protein
MSKERAPKQLSPVAATIGGLAVGYFIKSVASQRRVMQAEARANRMEELAKRDPLTGLYNRRALASAYMGLQTASAYERRSHDIEGGDSDQHSLIVFDIDHFKQFNDTRGHGKGDKVLRGVAHTLMTRNGRARERDVPVRMGGEEMSLLLPRAAKGDALAIAEELRGLIEQQGIAEGDQVTASFGVVELNLERSLDYNVDLADQALYAAKQQGRNQVVAYPLAPMLPSGSAA